MKRNVLSFFKSSACAKSFFVFGAAFLAILSISCKQLASFDPVVNGEQVVVGGGGNSGGDTSSLEAAEFSFNLKATHGLMRKISLEWTAFSGAKYYEIYFAESAAAEFTKIGETEQPFFDDAVAAGRTGYFKVCAVKANGSSTPFSSTVVGTSLAVPIIGGGEVNASSASISWFMENARGIDGTDYYEKSLKFEVVCQSKGESEGGENKVLSASSFSSTSYSYTFEELSSSKDYEFYVAAYLESDTQSRETSPTVDKTTLTTYTPLSPKFSASEGDSAKGISLLITLPEMVTVKTFVKESENQNIMQDVSYPLCFKVFRKHEKEKTYSEKNAVTLYYNGTNLTTSPVEYQEAGAPYEVGAQVTWFDGDASLIGGEKYDYMIRSFVDINYSKVVCVEGKEYETETGTPLDKANTSQGWKSAPPSFNVKVAEDGGRKLSADNTKVVSVSFGFSAEWNDLGKAGDYKFAIRQTYAPFTSESGTSAWLKNGETIYFDTLDGIKALVKTFGSDSGLPKAEQGTYSYTLYVVSKNDNGTSDIESNDNVLDSVNARDRMVVTEDVSLPKAELAVQGGYKNKVHFKILTCEPNVKYRLERTKMVDGKPTDEIKDIQLDNIPASGTFEGDDTTVQGNCSYSYVLKAVAASGVPAYSTAQPAETLGTPKVAFEIDEKEGLPYDSVTVSFDGVLAAKNYYVTLGSRGDFGGGKTYSFTAGTDGTSGDMKVLLAGNKYTVTINKPEGYNDAILAGKFVDAFVTAKSDAPGEAGEAGEAKSDGVSVNVLGPALLDAKVNTFDEAKEDSISLTWNKVADAKGYLIRRVMYSDIEMKDVAGSSDVTYYYEVSSGMILADGDSETVGDRAKVTPSDAGFELTDKYMEITTSDETLKEYQEKQSKIAWGLPFRYIVLPVFEKGDFDFKDDSLELTENGKVVYKKLAPTEGTATYGYGLKVQATKSESATNQEVSWEKPFYGENLTPKVYRRKFANRDKNEWEAVNATVKSDAITYSPSGDDRYCAWEYVVKYRNDTSDKIAQSYVDWLKNSDHDETRYDYGSADKEKLNKGYLLAMDYSAYYGGGESPSKTDDDYYSEDVEITKWYYNDRTLGPDKVELKVLSLDLSSGWQTVGTLDSEITSFTASTLTDTTVEANLNDKVIKLKPTTISNNKNGTGTTDGPLKILRSAKHYYGLNLSRGGNEPQFDYKNYEEYAYRQITDEELIKSTMLVVAEVIKDANLDQWDTGTSDKVTIISKASVPVNGMKGSFDWSQCSHSAFWWTFSGFVEGWKELPYGEYASLPEYKSNANRLSHFITVDDNSSRAAGDDRGKKDGTDLKFLCYRVGSSKSIALFGCKWGVGSFSTSAKIPLTITSDIGLETYKATVNFASSDNEFVANVTRTGYTGADLKNTNGKNDISYWIPANINGIGYKGQDSAYGWWNN